MGSYQRYANSLDALAIKIANEEDIRHFSEQVRSYNHEPHAHWATTTSHRLEYRCICLGEYENDVTRGFLKSIADGLIALAICLQTAGTENAHVSKRHYWALWLGKEEYNTAILAKPKKGEEVTVATDEEIFCNECDNVEEDCECGSLLD